MFNYEVYERIYLYLVHEEDIFPEIEEIFLYNVYNLDNILGYYAHRYYNEFCEAVADYIADVFSDNDYFVDHVMCFNLDFQVRYIIEHHLTEV